MNRHAAGALASLTLALGALAHDTTSWMVAFATGGQEVPPTPSVGWACGYFEIDKIANTMKYRIVHAGLSGAETTLNLHGPADPGVDGLPLDSLGVGTVKSGTWHYPDSIEADLLAGRCYFNIHTTAFPDGEIRGQIVSHVALIDGAQAVPPTASTAKGIGLFMVDDVTDVVRYYIKVDGLAGETGAEIGGFALHGAGAPTLAPLALGAVKTGSFAYAPDDEQKVLNGLMYVNVRTGAFPAGAVRGQIVGTVSPLDGKQEVPPNASGADGWSLVAIDTDANALSYDVGTAGIVGETSAAIYGYAPAGFNASPRHTLPAGARKLGTWVYSSSTAETSIFKRFAYFNVLTGGFPGGEIRGQIMVLSHRYCPADFNDDDFVTGDDFDEYVTEFEFGNPSADVNYDGFVTGDDFDHFSAHFESGC